MADKRSTDAWRIQHEVAGTSLRNFLWLYNDWIFPNKPSDFVGKSILDAGSGPGIQLELYAAFAKNVVAVDLEAIETSKNPATLLLQNVKFIQDNIMTMELGEKFDVVNCVGTIHHTDNPSLTFKNLFNHLKSGGRMIIWAYAKEGNFLMEKIVEPFRKKFLMKISKNQLILLSKSLTVVLYLLVYSIYLFPLKKLPYFDYFVNFRKLNFERNMMNVYDKLNAPQQYFISRETIELWFNSDLFTDIYIGKYAGVSWRASGTKK